MCAIMTIGPLTGLALLLSAVSSADIRLSGTFMMEVFEKHICRLAVWNRDFLKIYRLLIPFRPGGQAGIGRTRLR